VAVFPMHFLSPFFLVTQSPKLKKTFFQACASFSSDSGLIKIWFSCMIFYIFPFIFHVKNHLVTVKQFSPFVFMNKIS